MWHMDTFLTFEMPSLLNTTLLCLYKALIVQMKGSLMSKQSDRLTTGKIKHCVSSLSNTMSKNVLAS